MRAKHIYSFAHIKLLRMECRCVCRGHVYHSEIREPEPIRREWGVKTHWEGGWVSFSQSWSSAERAQQMNLEISEIGVEIKARANLIKFQV